MEFDIRMTVKFLALALRPGVSSGIYKVVPSIRDKLEELTTLGNVRVSFNTLTGNVPQACAASPGVEIRITFLSQNGYIPALTADTTYR